MCAFFDDATLANSLPNGKRKRGLNDNRKGLDQNIVGAIKGTGKKDTDNLICLFVSGWYRSDVTAGNVLKCLQRNTALNIK